MGQASSDRVGKERSVKKDLFICKYLISLDHEI